ncbi:29176_t:CDS:2, partial [Gigaspora margarita]
DLGDVKFRQPIIFDEYNESRSAVDILNNLCDNMLFYHDIIESKRSTDHIFAFYLAVAEANSFSAYCKFVPRKQNTKHVNFHKQLVRSIFEYYSYITIADRTRKRKKQDSDHEHRLTNLTSDSATSRLKTIVIVQLPVVAVLLHEECVKIVGAIISIWLL